MPDFASLNDNRIIDGKITIPNLGIWTADVKIAVITAMPATPGGVTIIVGDLVLVGTVYRQAAYGGARSFRIVGGYGGWRNTLTPRSYDLPSGVRASMVLGDAAKELGERVAFASDYIIGPKYVRAAMQGAYVLGQLAGPLWWMRPDGLTYVGPRATGLVTSQFTVINFSGSAGRFTVASDSIADFAPGRNFSAPVVGTSNPISLVEHVLPGDGNVRTEVLTTP